jgi:hypothetical protein
MKVFLYTFLLLCTIPAFSQIQTRSLGSDEIKIKLVKETPTKPLPQSFRQVIILDSRDDTASLGYLSKGSTAKKYIFKSGTQTELSNWYYTYLNPREQNLALTLLVNIKKLRLSNEIMPVTQENGHTGQSHNGWEKGVIIKIEYFLQQESSFFPLYRFDSVITSTKTLPKNADDYISTALKLSMEKLFSLDLEKISSSKNKIAFTDILRVNEQRYKYPIYFDSVFKKGVYKNFDEFRMNEPSMVDFEFRKGKWGDILFVKKGNEEYPARDTWGFCDGKNIFINSGDKYSKLIQSGNSFYFEGIKTITRKQPNYTTNYLGFQTITLPKNYGNIYLPKQTKFEQENRYYQVDMETGEVY